MEKKEKQVTKKQPKTIKVKTVLIAVGVLVALIASFVAGWNFNTAYHTNIDKQVTAKFEQLKK